MRKIIIRQRKRALAHSQTESKHMHLHPVVLLLILSPKVLCLNCLGWGLRHYQGK